MEEKQILENWEYFKSLLRKTNREGIEEFIDWLDSTDFKYAPASTQFHGSFRGGLLLHSLNVYYHMYDFKNFIDFFQIPDESVILSALLHDICKVNVYITSMRNKKDENGKWIQVPYYEWDDLEAIGHGAKSVMLMYEHGIKPTNLERAMIVNHMGYSEGSDNRLTVSTLFKTCPQSLVLHWADELSTFVTENSRMSDKYKQRLFGRNLNESNNYINQINSNGSIKIGDKEFRLAPEDSEVDGEKIINLKLQNILLKVFKD